MQKKLVEFNLAQRSKKVPDLKPGDVVKIHRRIVDKDKETIQVFEGLVIAIKGRQSSSPTITVRKVSHGVGVELILPLYSPIIKKIDVVKRAQVRKSKLYYVRDKSAKSLKMKYKELASVIREEEKEEVSVSEKKEEAAQ